MSAVVGLPLWVLVYSLWRATRRTVLLMDDWQHDGWAEHGWAPTVRSRVGDFVMHRVRVAFAIWYCIGLPGAGDFGWDDGIEWMPRYQQWLYRAKAVVCLLLGRHYQGDEHWRFDGVRVVWWNGAVEGYYEPEWSDDSVEVGLGWSNWHVILNCMWSPWSRR